MRTLKPLALTVMHGPFQHRGKVRLVVVVGAMVSLDGTKIEQEYSLWRSITMAPRAAPSLGPAAPAQATAVPGYVTLDEVKPKVRGEALLTGYAYAPRAEPAPVVAARFAVGPIAKELWVIGDRVWKASGPSEPTPFVEMPLGWDRAFGGEGYASNPIGKGFSSIKDEAGESVHPLPNVELAKKLVTSARDRPAPAGFGPIDPSWPQRAKKAGTYDKKWLETKYPEVADDFDPTYFNLAPEDQWIEGPWQGGEAFTLENLNAERPRLEGVVPSFVARCLVTRHGAEDSPEDVQLRCDTLWFLPHLERVIMLFRGGVDVADEEGSDVADLMVALERKGAPRPVEHYRSVRALRIDRQKGAVHALRDGDLIPDDLTVVRANQLEEMDELTEREGLLQRNMRRRGQRELDQLRDRLKAAGVDPDAHLPKDVPEKKATPKPEDVPQMMEDIGQQVQKAKADAEDKREKMFAELRDLCKAQGIDLDAKVKQNKQGAGGPYRFNADAQIAKMKELLAQAKKHGAELPPAAVAKIEDPALHTQLRKAERTMKEAYRRSVHYAPAAEALEEPDAARVRRDVEATLAAGASLAERDLTGADLSGIDFSGRDLTGAFLEKANLRGCSFRGAKLERAVFARATLAGVDFEGARAAGANFGEADLTGAKLTGGIDLAGAVFYRANLGEADLTGAVLDGAELTEARCQRAVFRGARAKKLTIMKADLRGLDLREAELVECNLLEVDLSGADLGGATLTRTALLDVTADDARFAGARMDKLRVVKAEKGSSLARAVFRGAQMRGANLRGVNLAGADFADADLTAADFSGANLVGANLEGARAADARFMKADLTGANAARADLMNALLGGAIVRGASFEEANVFRADAAKMKGDDKTSFKGANVKQVRVVPDRSGDG